MLRQISLNRTVGQVTGLSFRLYGEKLLHSGGSQNKVTAPPYQGEPVEGIWASNLDAHRAHPCGCALSMTNQVQTVEETENMLESQC